MQDEFVTVYDQAGRLLAVLENATDVSYVLTHNDLWTASFSLPSGDPKNALCEAHNLVSLPDDNRKTGLYRIVGMPTSQDGTPGGQKTYSIEHVMATLLDDVLFGYHEIGGEGVTTRHVAEYILSHQTVKRWKLGACEFADEYAYKFENTALLPSLLSLANVLTEEYTWEFDTSSGSGTEADPWIVNLRKADSTPGCGIHYMRNMVEIEKSMDATTLVTRLYLLGYGEGVNQLTIKDVNGGVPYVEADTASKWGVKCSVYADTRIEDAATLKARGLAVLEKYKNPYISYTASAIDLARLTGHSWDSYMPGKLVQAMDGEHGIEFCARIVSISKSDMRGRPGEIEITIANAARDAADSMNALADRMGIAELYSQGATNLYSQQYADNADETHPAIMRVYVPSGCVRINQMLLSWSTEAFRAYETGAAAGGGTATTTESGGASTSTSSAGGSDERTSRAGGAYATTVEQRVVSTTGSTGGAIRGHSGDTSGMTSYAYDYSGNAMSTTGEAALTIGDSTLLTTDSGGGSVSTSEAGSHAHTGGKHTHIFGHYHSIPSHTHAIGSHTHSGPSHRHSFSGSDSLANGHTHTVTVKSLNKATTTTGVSTNGIHKVAISGDTGYAGTGTTGSATPTCGDGGSGTTGNAIYASGNSHTETAEGGAVATTSNGAHTHTMGNHTHGMQHTHSAGKHSHSMGHTHEFKHSHNVTVVVTIPEQKITIPGHSHVVEIAAHTHTVTIPDHTHDLTLEDHTHEIIHGIYEGGTARNVTLYVDDNEVPAESVKASEMDIVQYLAKDEDGKITRGTWHEIKIVPDSLTRIEANLFVQTFVQSVGGGDY